MKRLALPGLLVLCLGLGPGAFAQQQPLPPRAAPAAALPSAAAPPAATTTPAAAAAAVVLSPHKWDLDRIRCADLLHAADEDRASAAMFYYGYLAAKAGIHVIDTGRISDNIAKVMQLCEKRPSLTVPEAFRDAFGPRRRR